MIDYSTLNPAQYAAVFSDHSRILCLAGAGTGKTQVLTRRVARLNESGIPAGKMLALTFTRAAGAEMKDRVISLIGDEGKQLFCNTFHAFCVNVIREHADLIGYESSFSIYDPNEQAALMNKVIQDLKIKLTPAVLTQVREGRGTMKMIQRKQAETALKEYKARLRRNNALDFESLIEYTRELLSRPEIAEKYRERYTHIFVDEFQDTDPTQWELVCKINPENLFVVGDDFQAIYGFRGSDIKIILSLAENPEWETIKLEMNYRSTTQIIASANNLIKHNKQTKKILIAQKSGDNIEFTEPKDEDEEIRRLLPRLNQNLALGISTAILARTNKQIHNAQAILKEYGIPFSAMTGAVNPFMRAEAKVIFDWLDALGNPDDDEAVANIACRELSPGVIARIEAAQYESNDRHFLECAKEIEAGKAFVRRYEKISSLLYDSLCDIVELLADELQIDNIQPLLAGIEQWENRQAQLGETTSLKALREYARYSAISEIPVAKLTADEIHLMTVHGSKGLEFEDVIIIGATQGLFPNKGDIEEERRLFYVAVTRARERLVINSPRTVADYHGTSIPTEPSQFIGELQQP